MSSSGLVQSHHVDRKAVIYIRQSSGHQVLSNLESGKMQHAMRDHARRLGWDESRVEIVEADTGVSATSTAGRDAYKNLLSEVALGRVGIVISYESARLSRNCSDWTRCSTSALSRTASSPIATGSTIRRRPTVGSCSG